MHPPADSSRRQNQRLRCHWAGRPQWHSTTGAVVGIPGRAYHGTRGAAAAAVGAGADVGAVAPWDAHDGAPWDAHDGAPWEAPTDAVPSTREIGAHDGAPSEAAWPLATPATAPDGSTGGASTLLRFPFGADATGAVPGAMKPNVVDPPAAQDDAHDKTDEGSAVLGSVVLGSRGVDKLEAGDATGRPDGTVKAITGSSCEGMAPAVKAITGSAFTPAFTRLAPSARPSADGGSAGGSGVVLGSVVLGSVVMGSAGASGGCAGGCAGGSVCLAGGGSAGLTHGGTLVRGVVVGGRWICTTDAAEAAAARTAADGMEAAAAKGMAPSTALESLEL